MPIFVGLQILPSFWALFRHTVLCDALVYLPYLFEDLRDELVAKELRFLKTYRIQNYT